MIIVISLVSGFVIGIISGLIGIGGGAMFVPLFVFLFKMDMVKAVGTSLAIIAPVSLVGAYSHHLKGNVELSQVLWIVLGAVVGIFLSGSLIQHIPEAYLRKGFAIFMVVIAVKIFFK